MALNQQLSNYHNVDKAMMIPGKKNGNIINYNALLRN